MISSAPTYRPVLIYGAGIHLSGAENEALEFAEKHQIPVAPTWAALDIIPSDDPLCIGSFGTHGTRAGNFAVQNATHIVSIGSRLDSKATGTPIESFARAAHITMVDIDKREINKFNGRVQGVCTDALEFLKSDIVYHENGDTQSWLDQIARWKEKYPVGQDYPYDLPGVNPYAFLRELSHLCEEGDIICTDTGCAVAWVSQAWQWKKGQRFIHAFNQTPMGYGLPAAIGAYYAAGRRTNRIILVTGDGSLMMSLGELATAKDLPIKIFMFNNKGHAMCRQTQREWLGGTYPSTSIEGGLKFPKDWGDLALSGFGIHRWYIDDRDKQYEGPFDSPADVIQSALDHHGPTFVQVDVPEDADVVPKVKYGHANEDGHPQIDISKEMLIPLWTAN